MASFTARPSSFSLSMLPESKAPWSKFALSMGTQALVLIVFAGVRLVSPETVEPLQHTFRSVQLVPTPPPENHAPQPKLIQQPVVEARLETPAPNALRLPAPQPKPKPVVEETVAPEVAMTAKKLDVMPAAAPIIPKTIKTNVFSSGSSATPTMAHAADKVQTGGFGDPNGVPAKESTGKAVNIAAAGSFDLPAGPGYGNGTGGSKGARGVVVSSGFGSGTATADPRSASRGVVKQGGFGDSDVAAPPTVRAQPAQTASKTIQAEILSKPTPIYTEEARKLRVQGEVLLEVVLEAGGKLRVLRVVRGLGHGLDDEAVREAEQIRFKPAQRDGQATDSTVVLHIIFQLA